MAVPGKNQRKSNRQSDMHHLLNAVFCHTVQSVLLVVGAGLRQMRIILKSNNERLFFPLQSENESERREVLSAVVCRAQESM